MVRIAGFAGVLTVFLGGATVLFPFTGESLNIASTPAAVVTYYAANRDSIVASSAFLPLLFILIVIFAAGQYALLRPREIELGDAWTLVGIVGIAGSSIVFTVSGGISLGMAHAVAGPGQGQDAALTVAAYTRIALEALGSLFGALFLGGFGLAAWRTGLAPRWSAGLALIGGALSLLGLPSALASGPWDSAWYLVSFVLLLWVVIESVRMIRASSAGASAIARPAMATR